MKKQTPEEYANELIEKYYQATISGWKPDKIAIQCAIIDIENSYEALDKNYGNIPESQFDFYRNALEYLKTK